MAETHGRTPDFIEAARDKRTAGAVPAPEAGAAPDADAVPDLVEADLLVEDVSIDGMCGVY